jgi:fructokinase
MLTGLSYDLFGQQLLNGLRESQVDTSHVIHSDRPTTLAFVELSNGQAQYSFYDENTAGRVLAPKDLPKVANEVQVLYFGGISLACEPCADTYAGLLADEGDDRVVMIDPNVRPAFIANETRYRKRLGNMIAGADIVKISDEDLDWLLDGNEPLETKATSLLKSGPSFVIMTLGDAGATAFLKNGQKLHVAAERVTVIDTVGAGDTFNAGVLCELSERGCLTKSAISELSLETAEKALGFGVQVAAITVARSGANPPWRNEI